MSFGARMAVPVAANGRCDPYVPEYITRRAGSRDEPCPSNVPPNKTIVEFLTACRPVVVGH